VTRRQPGKVDAGSLSGGWPASTIAVWDARDCASVGDGNAVTNWTDRIGGLVASGSSTARPLYRAAGVGSIPTLEFDGSNDALIASPGTNSQPLGSSTSGWAIAVIAPDITSGNRCIWQSSDDGGGGAGNNIFGGIFSGDMRMQAAVSATANWVYTAASTGLASWEWASSGSAWTIRKNNVLQTLTLGGGSNNGAWLNIAGRDRLGIGTAVYNNINDSWFDGHIALLAFGNSPLTADERAIVYDLIYAQYGAM